MKWCVVFCLFWFCFGVGFVDCLKASQKGVCVSKHTATKTRPITILVPTGKWCGTKKCTVKQTRKQKYTVVTNQLMCCKGYVYTSATDSCAPVCSTGCANGTCVDPDVCQCAPPLYLDATTRNKCLEPTCDHPCINGMCSENNTCVCKENYTPFNATHCALSCQEGFKLDVSLNCVLNCAAPLYLDITKNKCLKPICDHPCVNGMCSGNNTCVCKDNYTPFNATHCALNCQEGFELDNSLNCVRKCTAPLYLDITENKCVTPSCNHPCINGICSGNNTCKCNEDYTAFNATHCALNCKEGFELGFSLNCVLKSKCDHGYKYNFGKCEPVCDPPCVNGLCAAPNMCECEEGLVKKNRHVCLEKQHGCGECSANGTCLMTTVPETVIVTYNVTVPCIAGGGKCVESRTRQEIRMKDVLSELICCPLYAPDDDDNCVPECPNGCENGTCVAPNVCACAAPLVLYNSAVPFACRQPVCAQPCLNGTCTASNQCTCNEGYTPKDTYTCVPHCTQCTNGDCVSPDDCKCHKGYTKINNQCTPHCKSGCSNGYCSAPDTCTCNDRYERKDDKCQPICKKPCLNGHCIAPNNCQCKKGYEPKNGRKEICIPKCNHGYELKDDICQPVCKKTCQNGNCVAPDTCKCLEGYDKDGNKYTCLPKCDACANGVCIAPAKCHCKQGYRQTDKGCIPNCDQVCVNGYCSGPNECSCKIGYVKDTSNSSVCYEPCGMCEYGSCKDGLCVCETDMDFINGTCVVSSPGNPEMSSGITDTTGLASVQMTWLVGGAVVLLLVVLVLVVIGRLYTTRNPKEPQKAPDDGPYGSVAYTIPNTLFQRDDPIEEEDSEDTLLDKSTNVV